MTNYGRDNKRGIGERMVRPLIGVLVLLVLYVFGPGLAHISLRAILSITTPVWKASNTLADNRESFFAMLAGKESLVEENTALRKQAAELTLVRAENEQLRTQVATFTHAGLPTASLLASVIAAPPHSVYDTLIVDVSHLSGVHQGMLVLSLDGAALGTLADVSGGVAKVLLFSSSGVQTSGSLGASTTPIDLIGRGGGAFRAIVPSRIKITAGEWITSSLLGSRIIALVEAVTPDASALSATIDARIPVPFAAINTVVLINAPSLHQ